MSLANQSFSSNKKQAEVNLPSVQSEPPPVFSKHDMDIQVKSEAGGSNQLPSVRQVEEGESSNYPPPPLDEPLEFAPYEASLRVRSDNHMVSHDPHLNEDGEALYRFLLDQAATPPIFRVGCKGTHKDRGYDGNGGWHDVTVTDFRFYLEPPLLNGPLPIFIVGEREVAFRGRIFKEFDAPPINEPSSLEAGQGGSGSQWRRKAPRPKRKLADERAIRMTGLGLPPWTLAEGEPPGTQARIESEEDRYRFQLASRGATNDSDLQAPSKSLRAWADDYCASNKIMKEFNFDKVVYGWDLEYLRGKIYNVVKANWNPKRKRSPKITVWFETTREVVSVRPDHWLSRMLSRRWIKALLCIFLIYPLFIWPAKRFYGGEWRVAGSAYALTRWVHLEDSLPGESADAYRSRVGMDSAVSLKNTPRGVSKLEGPTEEAWFDKWETTIADMTQREVTTKTGIDALGP
ncbi:hypothetical protein FRB93_008264 [Tulasnella sp. JGI-2019a]|nr:hypothetical protein FRB93_008264 [Tulasnella sp. JGI-2019a]